VGLSLRGRRRGGKVMSTYLGKEPPKSPVTAYREHRPAKLHRVSAGVRNCSPPCAQTGEK
jgi:hypothetical protein